MRHVMVFFLLMSFSAPALARRESWYKHVGLGYGFGFYPGLVLNAVNGMKGGGSSPTDIPVAFDFGLYWPLGQRLIAGISINGLVDGYFSGSSQLFGQACFGKTSPSPLILVIDPILC